MGVPAGEGGLMLPGKAEEMGLTFVLRTGDIGQNADRSPYTGVEKGPGRGSTSQARLERRGGPGESPGAGPTRHLPSAGASGSWVGLEGWGLAFVGIRVGILKNMAARSWPFRPASGGGDRALSPCI